MVDIYCVQCGEPWNAWGASHGDMEAWEYDLFRKGAGCPCCEGKPSTPFQPTELKHVEFGDEDPALRINAFMDRDEDKLPPWEPPPPPEPHYGDVWEAMNDDERLLLDADEEDLECAKSFSWGKVNPANHITNGVPVCVPRYLTGSDYSGGCVERANYKVFMEMYGDVDGVYELYGGHGTYGVAILASVDHKEMAELLASLNDYPVISDEAISEYEMEAENEAWENWAASDFRSALINHLADENIHSIEEILEDVDDDLLNYLFRWASEDLCEYWQCETGGGMYIDVDRIAKHFTMADVLALLKDKEPA